MDENANKKRRNLMLTSTAVCVAGYLELKLPPGIISGLSRDGSLLTDPHKVWIVVLVVLGYQLWRFFTDSDTHRALKNTQDFFDTRICRYAPRSHEKAIFATVRAKSRFGYKVVIPISIPPADSGISAVDWTGSKVAVITRDNTGEPHGAALWLSKNQQVRFHYNLIDLTGQRAVSSATVAEVEVRGIVLGMWSTRAALQTSLRSSDCQDWLVPAFIALSATTISMMRILSGA